MNTRRCKVRPYFEENLGQLPQEVMYKVKMNDYVAFFTEDKLVVSLPSNIENTRNIFYMKLENKNDNVYIEGEEKQKGKVNYFIGKDKEKWITNIPTYSKVKYEQVYENIDLYYYIDKNNLEYDFVLSKGSNPKDISISFEGVDKIEIDKNNDIVLTVGDMKAKILKPVVYQIIDNKKIKVDCEYTLNIDNEIGFLVNEYEKEYELVLDPVLKLDYSTYIGGKNCDYGRGIVVDSEGCAYITGYTEGDYPTTKGQTTYGGGGMDAFVTKLSADGSELVYSTYLGGSAQDFSNGIAIDYQGCAYVVGETQSEDFPITEGAYQTTHGGGIMDAFVTKISVSGSFLAYSTYIGGSKYDAGRSIVVDSKGYSYITGLTQGDYPVTNEAYQTEFGGNCDVFVSKIDVDGKNLIYSTYIGGKEKDVGNSIALDKDGCVYITGYAGENYPITTGAYQQYYGGDKRDTFVTKLNSSGSELVYSTYIGGSAIDQGNAITVDDKGYTYIVGYTQGESPVIDTSGYIFISKLSTDGFSLIYYTYIGGTGIENAYSVAVDSKGYAYIAGYTDGDITFIKINIDGSELINYTHLNSGVYDYGRGITLDAKDNIYIIGYAESNYPTTIGAYQAKCAGHNDVIVSKIQLIDFDISWIYNPNEVKLLDIINTELTFTNFSPAILNVNVKFQPLDSTVSFIENTLSIQNISRLSSTIPSSIYLSNIKQKANIKLDLKYVKEKYPNSIPIKVIVEIYDTTSKLINSITKTFYIFTTVGANYIPGCNQELYNLEINGKLQTTPSGVPIIYYKSGTSYIYTEPSENKYAYRVLANPTNVIEYLISI